MCYNYGMSKKLKQILAIIALVFMAIFTVAFVVWLVNPNLLGGKMGFVCLITGGIGVALFLAIKFSKDYITDEKETDGNENSSASDSNTDGAGANDNKVQKENPSNENDREDNALKK